MSEVLASKLERLAPTVDLAASRELFQRSRHSGRRTAAARADHRILLAVASVVLLIAGGIGVWAVSSRGGDAPAVVPMPTESGDGTEFEVLAVEPLGAPAARSIRTAGTYDDLLGIVSRFGSGLAERAADVDLRTQVAVVFERGGASSPDELAGFTPAGDEWIAEWREPGGGIDDVGLGYVYLVAVDRSALAGIEWFVDPADQQGTIASEELRVAVPGGQPVPEPDEGAVTVLAATVLLDVAVPSADLSPGAVGLASTPAEYDALWATFGNGIDRPPAELDGGFVMAFTLVDDGCPAAFDGLRVDESPVVPRVIAWLSEAGAAADCASGEPGRLIVVSVEAGPGLAPVFDFTVPSPYAPEVTTRLSLAQAASATTLQLSPAGAGDGPPIAFAVSRASLDGIAEGYGVASQLPEIDMATSLVVAFAIAPDQCFDGFDRFVVEGDVWRPLFLETDACRTRVTPRLVVVEIDRSALTRTTTFRYDDATLTVDPGLAIVDAAWACGPADGREFAATIDLAAPSSVLVEVRDGATVLGSTTVRTTGGDGTTPELGFSAGPPSPTAELVVTDTTSGDEVARMQLGHLPIPTCG